MVSGISNVGYQPGVNATTNARPYMQGQYQYASAPEGDTVELSTKKKGKTGKTILGVVAGVAAAGLALFGLVKTGKLTKVENASKWTEKLQNLAYAGGDYVGKGINWCTTKGGDALKWVKGKFSKNAAETVAEAATK